MSSEQAISSVFPARRVAAAPFGIELDIDPTVPLDDDQQAELRRLFLLDYLLLIREREMSAADQYRLASHLGAVLSDPRKSFVSNTRRDGILGEKELVWHTDVLFAPDPYLAIGLYALDVDPGQTSTRFASTVRAQRRLPAELRDAARGKRAISVHRFDRDVDGPWAAHDVLWRHPETGDTLVFVDDYHTARIEDLEPTESSSLLRDLRANISEPGNVFEHHWYPHDFVIWDNRAVQHSRGPLPAATVGTRTLRRVVVGRQTVEDQFPGFVSSYNDLAAAGLTP